MFKKPEIKHYFLREGSALQRMELTASERETHLLKIRKWHTETPGFKEFLQKVEQTDFWNYLNKMPMPAMIDYMLEDNRHFKSEVEKLYLNKIKELLIPENDIITKIKLGRNQQERLEIINKEIIEKLDPKIKKIQEEINKNKKEISNVLQGYKIK